MVFFTVAGPLSVAVAKPNLQFYEIVNSVDASCPKCPPVCENKPVIDEIKKTARKTEYEMKRHINRVSKIIFKAQWVSSDLWRASY